MGPADLVWRGVTSSILKLVNNLGLDNVVFLIDPKSLNLKGLPLFNQSVVKCWTLFNHRRCMKADLLHCLLKKPLIHGARLDISGSSTPDLTGRLIQSGTLTMGQLVDAVGPDLNDVQALGSRLRL